MTNPRYKARVLWHCPDYDRWELETEHGGFETPIAAARFANRIDTGPEALIILGGRATVLLGNRTEVHLTAGAVRLWRLLGERTDADVAHDDDYEEVGGAAADLSRAGLDGAWDPVGYDIEGPGGRIDVSVTWAE